MDNNETKPLEDWRNSANQRGHNAGYNQPANPQPAYNQNPQFNQTQYGKPQYVQNVPMQDNATQPYIPPQQRQQPQNQPYQQPYAVSNDVPEEVAEMRIGKLVWSFILFTPLAIPALIFFIKAKSEALSDPDQAIYFSGRFNFFSGLAIKIGIILFGIFILYYIIMIAVIASNF